MNRYIIQKKVGGGTYGTVFKAIDRQTQQIVAIKHMKKKFSSWEECLNLRELKSLRKLSCPNIIKLKQVIRVNEELFFVFEYMEQNLRQFINYSGHTLTDNKIRLLMFQALNGLKYAHQNGFFHRDIKLENLLVQGDLLKIADFGLARETNSQQPFTEYISTRWYRAPELLLRSKTYSTPIDVFALGVVMAELYTHKPLFSGISERDQLLKEFAVLGIPNKRNWPEGYKLMGKLDLELSRLEQKNLKELIPKASDEAIDLMLSMMELDPNKRITANECLLHPYFSPLLPKPSKSIINAKNKAQSTTRTKKSNKSGIKITSLVPKELLNREYISSNISQYKDEKLSYLQNTPLTAKLLNKIKKNVSFSKSNYNLPAINKKKVLALYHSEIRRDNESLVRNNYAKSRPAIQFSPYHNTPFYVPTLQNKSQD